MYENITYETILKRMLARVPSKIDKREGSVLWDTHSPTAIELQILYLELDTILREAYGDTASREFLVLRCRERGIAPYPATHAVLKGVFTPADADVMGQRFSIGSLNYVVTEKTADGEYQVQCESAGSMGNRFLGSMIPVEYIRGLQTAELVEVLIPGEEEEETEELRQRYFDSFHESAFGGNVADYLEKTNAIPGVGKTKVMRVWNGELAPASMIPSPAVQEWYERVKGNLPDEAASWLAAVYRAASEKKLTCGGTVLLTIINSAYEAASETLVQTVQEIVDPERNAGEGYGFAPIGHVVTVRSAQEKEITIKTELTFESGYGWDVLRSTLETAIAAYLLELRKAWAESPALVVRVSQIETRLLGVSGVLDVRNTLLNGQEENLILEKYEIPVFGGVSG